MLHFQGTGKNARKHFGLRRQIIEIGSNSPLFLALLKQLPAASDEYIKFKDTISML